MKETKTVDSVTVQEGAPVAGEPVPAGRNLPALRPVPARPSRARRWVRAALLLALLLGGGAVAFRWWQSTQTALPPGIAYGNGRTEADEIDIETKFAGRIAEILVDEGDWVKAGQVLARMDTRDLEASLGKAEAQVRQAQRSLDEAKSDLTQRQTEVRLAEQELERARILVPKGYATGEMLDMRQQQMNAARAALTGAEARIGQATHALDAANQDVALLRVNIADNTLVSPKDGRVQYRLANVGEVLPSGGKVFTLLDVAYVYMDIFLPTLQAGRVAVGSDGHLLLDALPDQPLPGKVTLVADKAQFTPKMVETQSERDKLMFRIRIRVDPAFLRAHPDMVRAGLPGVGYVRIDPHTAWPAYLETKLDR
jgi:HlyD family secretion protein